MTDYSLADIRAATENNDNDGWGNGNGWEWIIVLFLFMFGANGWGGFGNGGSGLTQAEMQQGFDTEAITRKLDALANGICDSTYALNSSIMNESRNITNNVTTEGRSITEAVTTEGRNLQQQLCELAAQANQNTCAITTAVHQEGEQTRALLYQNKMEAMQNEINSLQLQSALSGVVRYPTNFAYNAGPSPFCAGGCGYSNNI